MPEMIDFDAFEERARDLVENHPVVVGNTYTKWFARGEATRDEVRHLAVQFSVFSHLFVEAQLRKVINAPTIEQYHAGKEILMNELGVVFHPHKTDNTRSEVETAVLAAGTVDGSQYRHG